MTVKLIGRVQVPHPMSPEFGPIPIDQSHVKEFIGTIAERVDADITDADPGSTYWAYDEKKGYVLADTGWQPLV